MVCNLKKQQKLKNLTQEQNCHSIHMEQGNRERDIEEVTTLHIFNGNLFPSCQKESKVSS